MKKLLTISMLAAASVATMPAQAFKFDTPDDWSIRWDNTVKGNLMMRVQNQDPSIYDPRRADPSLAANLADDATYSVDKGNFVSQRADLLSELDVIWKDKLGFRISGAGWYDFAYDGSNDAPSSGPTKAFPAFDSTAVNITAAPYELNDYAKDYHYRGGELLDAFVFANFNIGDVYANVRVGRHTLVWGQSLLAVGTVHGFAGSMVALDLGKGLGTPGSEAKELFIPNDKISSTFQFDNWTVSAFYAMGFEPLRWPAANTYFSLNETSAPNSECLAAIAGGVDSPRTCLRSTNYKYKDSGDWGFNVEYYVEPWDLEVAFIYMNNTDRVTSGMYSVFGDQTQDEIDEAARANANLLGHYGWVFKNDVDTFGISLSKQMFDISWGADFVYRNNTGIYPDATSSLLTYPAASQDSVGPGSDYPGATGDTVHVVLNGVGFLSPDWGLWDGGTYIAELSMSNLLHYGQWEEKASRLIGQDEWNSNISGVFKPTWYQVRPGWDLSAPMSINYTLHGRQAPITAGGNEKVGNASVGLEVDVDQTWNVALRYNIYYGPQDNGPTAYIKDRDNVALTVKRTF
jgi:hypothetical protein